MARALLFVLLVLTVLYVVRRLFQGIAQGMGDPAGARRGPAAPPAVRMAQDPVCGTYVVPGKALEVIRGRETLFFCSEKCRNQFLEQPR